MPNDSEIRHTIEVNSVGEKYDDAFRSQLHTLDILVMIQFLKLVHL